MTFAVFLGGSPSRGGGGLASRSSKSGVALCRPYIVGAGHEPQPRTNWQRSAEHAMERWRGELAYDLAWNRTEWAQSRKVHVAWCNATFRPRAMVHCRATMRAAARGAETKCSTGGRPAPALARVVERRRTKKHVCLRSARWGEQSNSRMSRRRPCAILLPQLLLQSAALGASDAPCPIPVVALEGPPAVPPCRIASSNR